MSENNDSTPNEKGENLQSNPVPQETVQVPVQEVAERKGLELSYISINFLKEIAKWTKFISIAGFIMVGFMALAGIAMGTIMGSLGSMMPDDAPAAASFSGGLVSFFYILMAGVYAIPVYYLYNFSSKLKSAIQLNSETELEDSFKNLKSHYKFMGVVLIIILSLYAVGIVFGLLFASMF